MLSNNKEDIYLLNFPKEHVATHASYDKFRKKVLPHLRDGSSYLQCNINSSYTIIIIITTKRFSNDTSDESHGEKNLGRGFLEPRLQPSVDDHGARSTTN